MGEIVDWRGVVWCYLTAMVRNLWMIGCLDRCNGLRGLFLDLDDEGIEGLLGCHMRTRCIGGYVSLHCEASRCQVDHVRRSGSKIADTDRIYILVPGLGNHASPRTMDLA